MGLHPIEYDKDPLVAASKLSKLGELEIPFDYVCSSSKGGKIGGKIGGPKGGKATREKLGLEHYSKMGKAGGAATWKKLGEEHYSKMGKAGGAKSRGRKKPHTKKRSSLRDSVCQVYEDHNHVVTASDLRIAWHSTFGKRLPNNIRKSSGNRFCDDALIEYNAVKESATKRMKLA